MNKDYHLFNLIVSDFDGLSKIVNPSSDTTLKKIYFTMSAQSVIEYRNNEPEYQTDLEEWLSEWKICTEMRKLTFIAQFARFKSFLRWQKSVNFKKNHFAKKFLNKNLFCLSEVILDFVYSPLI